MPHSGVRAGGGGDPRACPAASHPDAHPPTIHTRAPISTRIVSVSSADACVVVASSRLRWLPGLDSPSLLSRRPTRPANSRPNPLTRACTWAVLCVLATAMLVSANGALGTPSGVAPIPRWSRSKDTASDLATVEDSLADLEQAVDHGWMLITSVLIFFMQAGFALVEAGAVGSKDIISILLKNFTDFAISAIMYWLVGGGFHYGTTPFIGAGHDRQWFATDELTIMPKLFQSAMFCATAVTIVSGAVACRFSFHSYMVLCVIFSGFIYPVTASWVWGNGFLSARHGLGAIDFAGSGVVHLQGATIAMVACLFVGPRLGRFVTDPVTGKLTPSSDFNGNSIVLTALGTLILWFGWYGFNPGSTEGLSNGQHLVAALAALNTTLAACSALMTGLFLTRFMEKSYNFWDVLNSTLAGLVAITGACATVGPGPAIGIGVLAAFAYHFTNKAVLALGIDDVVGAFSVHGTPGAVGLLCTGLFSRQDYIDSAFGDGTITYSVGRQFGVQLLQVVCVFAWSAVSSALVLFILSRTLGVRVSEEDEIVGLDFKYHQGYAYETHNKRMLRARKQIEREQILGERMRKEVAQKSHAPGGQPTRRRDTLGGAHPLHPDPSANGPAVTPDESSFKPSVFTGLDGRGDHANHGMLAIREGEDGDRDDIAGLAGSESDDGMGTARNGDIYSVQSHQSSLFPGSPPIGALGALPPSLSPASAHRRRIIRQDQFEAGTDPVGRPISPAAHLTTAAPPTASKRARHSWHAGSSLEASEHRSSPQAVSPVLSRAGSPALSPVGRARQLREHSLLQTAPAVADRALLRHVSFESPAERSRHAHDAAPTSPQTVHIHFGDETSSPPAASDTASPHVTVDQRPSLPLSTPSPRSPSPHVSHAPAVAPPEPLADQQPPFAQFQFRFNMPTVAFASTLR